MRLLSRIVGVVLVLWGVGVFGLFTYVTLHEGFPSKRPERLVLSLFLAAGAGLIVAGFYYVRLDPNAQEQEQPPTRFIEFLATHRHQLKVLAQVGCLATIVHLVAACLGSEWPGRGTKFSLCLGVAVLMFVARKIADPQVRDNADWKRVPRWIQSIIRPETVLVLVALSAPLPLGHEFFRIAHRLAALTGIALVYALEALFFAYGELRSSSVTAVEQDL
jgi:hypothetical protein